MAKQRYIKDSFWTDSYIESLSPDYKLVFLYLLTNPQMNVAGVYEIRAKRIAFETGYDIEVIQNILNKFEEDGKIIYKNDWIVVVNFFKHLSLGSKTAEGVNRIIDSSPQEIQDLFSVKTVTNTEDNSFDVYILDTPYIPHIYPSETHVNSYKLKVKSSKLKVNKEKKHFGELENVKLTEDEYQKLVEKFGAKGTEEKILALGSYMASKGKKYKSHYATILSWSRNDKQLSGNTSKYDKFS